MQQFPAATAAARGPRVNQDEAHTSRLMDDPRLVVLVLGGNHFNGFHPFLEIVDVPLDVADDAEDFRDPDFRFGLAGVLLYRRHDFIGVRLHGRFQFPQFLFALPGS
jgi:hypothetical protein